MPRATSTFVCAALLLGTITIGCGDPKGSAGAIGAPVQKMDPSKMNKSAKDAKIAPQDSRAVKLNPEVPEAQQKVIPEAPVDDKALEATPVAPTDAKLQ